MSGWTPADDEYLRAHYETMLATDIGRKLGNRSAQAIRNRAHKIGIRSGRKRAPARGHGLRDGSRTTCVYFDAETFEQVRAMAKAEHLSFSKAALQLIEWGLMECKAA